MEKLLPRKALLDLKRLRESGVSGTEFDPEQPWSFYAILPDEALKAMDKVDIEMFSKTEDELEIICNPTPTLNRLRNSFWRAYNSAKEMRYPEIDYPALAAASGTTIGQMFKHLENPHSLAWILCPVVHHHEVMHETYIQAVRKMREALNAPVFTPEGSMDYKAVAEVRKIYELLDKRQHGEFVQNVNVSMESRPPVKTIHGVAKNSISQDVDEELRLLEEKLKDKTIVHAIESAKYQAMPALGSEGEDDEDEQLRARARERGIKIKTQET